MKTGTKRGERRADGADADPVIPSGTHVTTTNTRIRPPPEMSAARRLSAAWTAERRAEVRPGKGGDQRPREEHGDGAPPSSPPPPARPCAVCPPRRYLLSDVFADRAADAVPRAAGADDGAPPRYYTAAVADDETREIALAVGGAACE